MLADADADASPGCLITTSMPLLLIFSATRDCFHDSAHAMPYFDALFAAPLPRFR